MIESLLVGNVGVVRVKVGNSTVYLVDLYCRLPEGFSAKCDEPLSAGGVTLCYLRSPRGCDLVVLMAQRGERRVVEVIGGEVVSEGQGPSAEEAASRCLEAAKDLACAAP